jgi:hypothetical protein
MIFHNFAFKTIDMDNSKYFDRVPEIDKAIADHQEAHKGAYAMRLRLKNVVGTNRPCLMPVT